VDAPGNKGASSLPLLRRSGAFLCPYLRDRMARSEALYASRIDPAAYQELMNMGFRRSGKLVYRPACERCRECVPIRVPVVQFRSSRSQRRVWRRNADLHVALGPPHPSDEKWRIYVEYLRHRHDGTMSEDRHDFEDFLYAAVTDTLEMVYRVDDRIVAVGIVDLCPTCLSSVYFYFDPAESRRGLGTFGALWEIEECRRRGLAYWYAGYYVQGCPSMNYKANFRPHELLGPDGIWRPAPARHKEASP
jgi:arginyl-tRNA--protein-N-Asp/Glu arginylyltransferase